jgi:hypothetical protein
VSEPRLVLRRAGPAERARLQAARERRIPLGSTGGVA